MRSSSRRRVHPVDQVRHAGVPFSDSADFIAEQLPSAGEPLSVALTPRVAPRSLVHRYLAQDILGVRPELWFPRREYEGRASPSWKPGRSPVVSVGVRPVRRVTHHSPFASQRRLAQSWRAFNVLAVPVPRKVAFCVRRHVRRSVLFATGVAGRRRSPGRGGSYRRTESSAWRC